MKLLFTLLLSISTFLSLIAQKSGVISYSETVKMNITIDGDQTAGIDLSEYLPENMSSGAKLTFDQNTSSYKKGESEDGDLELGDEDAGIKIVVLGNDIDSELYIDHKANMKTDLRGFMGKAFIVEEEVNKIKWKITNEKVKYLDYECIKATSTNDENKDVVAWFAPQIPVSVGPMGYGQLPGAILMLSEGEEDLVIKATKVELKDVDTISKPTDGEKVSYEEFEKIVEERTKEMMQSHTRGF